MNERAREHLLAVARCPIVAKCLNEADPRHECARVVLSQWDGRTVDERRKHWHRFHQLPTP